MADTTATVAKSITVDVTKTNIQTVRMAQSDSATRYLNVKITDGDNVIPMRTEDYIFFQMRTPDNNYFLKECKNNGDNTCTVEFTANMLASQGVCQAQIVIATGKKDTNGDFSEIDTVLSTATFTIYVWESALNGVKQSSDFINIMTFINGAKYEESVRQANEKTRVEAETGRVTAETKRVEQEDLRKSNEETRQTNETTRQTNEDERKKNEDARKAAEIVRQNNETNRTAAEDTRKTEEEKRQTQEQSRDTAEKARIQNEADRNDAEVKRNTAETNRVDAEKDRVNEYTLLKHDMDNQSKLFDTQENARQDAEEQRDTAEKSRETAEEARIKAESERDQNEHDRMNAEKARATAEVVRESNEETRRQNERDRIKAERERVSNENQRKTNEENRIEETQNMIADGNNVIQQVSENQGDYIEKTQKAANNGVASLNTNGKVPVSQLPGSFVKTMYEGTAQEVTKSTDSDSTYATGFIKTGESINCTPEDDAVYVDTSRNITFRWTGSRYASIDSFAIGETSATAFAGDKGAELVKSVTAIKKRQGSIDGSPMIKWLIPTKYDTDGKTVIDGWNPTTKTYDFSKTYPNDTYNIEQLQPYGTKEQVKAFGEAMIEGSPTENKLTALGALPTIAIPVMFLVRKKKFDDDIENVGGTTTNTPTEDLHTNTSTTTNTTNS